jgi:integrase
MAVLREVVGGATPLDHIDRDTMRTVRDKILARPLAPASQRKYCRALGTIFAFAAQEKWIGADANPALGLAPKRRKEEAEDDKRPFTDEELAALFPEGWRLDDATDWMLALGLFQGLRAEEAAQLEVCDVGQVEGVWSLFIRDWTPTETGRDYSLGKSVKNEASERVIPVHARIAAPLLALAAARRAAGERMLLPGIKRWGKEGFYGSIRKKVTERLVAAGVKTKRTSHHSLRHNFRDAGRAARIPRDHALALGGWSLGRGAEADYGEGYTPATLAPSLDRLPFPEPAPQWEPLPRG